MTEEEKLDIVDWIILSGEATEGQISRKLNLKREKIRPVLKELVEKGFLKTRKSFIKIYYSLNEETDAGKKEKQTLLPSMRIVAAKKLFKTHLDILESLVNRFKRIEVTRLARFFNVDRDTIEGWARTLDGENLVVLSYPFVGEAVVLKKGEKESPFNSTLVKYILIVIILLAAIYYRQQILSILEDLIAK